MPSSTNPPGSNNGSPSSNQDSRLDVIMRETFGIDEWNAMSDEAESGFDPELTIWKITPEAPMTFKFADLSVEDEGMDDGSTTPASSDNAEGTWKATSHRAGDEDWDETPCRKEGLRRAKIVTAHFGTVPQHMYEKIAGKTEGVSQHFIDNVLPSIDKQIMESRFGEQSFIRAFIRGELSTHQVGVVRHRIALEIKSLEFDGLSEEELNEQKAKLVARDDRVKKMWEEVYSKVEAKALHHASTKRGSARKSYVEKAQFYAKLKANIPTPPEIPSLSSREEAERLKPASLFRRPKAERVTSWKDTFTLDVFASHYKILRDAVDLCALAEMELHMEMKRELWGLECEALSWEIAEQEAEERMGEAAKQMFLFDMAIGSMMFGGAS